MQNFALRLFVFWFDGFVLCSIDTVKGHKEIVARDCLQSYVSFRSGNVTFHSEVGISSYNGGSETKNRAVELTR